MRVAHGRLPVALPKDEPKAINETSTVAIAKEHGVPTATGRFTLHVLEGKDAGTSFLLDGNSPTRAYLGKSEACEVRLTDHAISRRHASLDVRVDHVRFTDVGSTNGSFVNDVKVRECDLRGGELVRIGQTTFRLTREAPVAVTLSSETRFGDLHGASPEMRRIYPLCKTLASSTVPVLVEGETGTGKEVLARALHEQGSLAKAPFVVFDCASVPPSLIEAALFGHERGAFTGAEVMMPGVFEQADGGTLFLDEIGDLDLALQPKLLRALEQGEVRRIGSTTPIKVKVRVISSTRRNLEAEIQKRRFRDDLFYRLAAFRLELPPLRERTGDIAFLAQHFFRKLAGDQARVPHALVLQLEGSRFPGNVRELANSVAYRFALGEENPLAFERGRAPRPPEHASPTSSASDYLERAIALDMTLPQTRQVVVEELERRYLTRVVEKSEGNIGRAAVAAGVARRYFEILRARYR